MRAIQNLFGKEKKKNHYFKIVIIEFVVVVFSFLVFACAAGIYRQSKLEYVVGATTGHIECIRLAIDDATDSITVTSIVRQNPIYKSQCSLYGLATSTNNAFTLMAQYVNVVSVELCMRYYVYSTTYTLNHGTESRRKYSIQSYDFYFIFFFVRIFCFSFSIFSHSTIWSYVNRHV